MSKRPASPLRVIPRIHRAAHQLSVHVGGWPHLELTQAEAHVLDHLATVGPCTIGTLHKAFSHRRSTLTSVLDRLTARALVERNASGTDRRTFVVNLTPAGRRVATAVHDDLRRIEERVLAEVSSRDVEGFERVLAGLGRVLGHHHER